VSGVAVLVDARTHVKRKTAGKNRTGHRETECDTGEGCDVPIPSPPPDPISPPGDQSTSEETYDPADLEISDEAIEFIKLIEGFEPKLYNDNNGNCTIGYGTLVHLGPCAYDLEAYDGTEAPFLLVDDPYETVYARPITEEEALSLLKASLADATAAVKDSITVELTQAKFDALVLVAYISGYDYFRWNEGFEPNGPTALVVAVNSGDFDFAAEILATFYGPNPGGGTQKARALEARMFALGIYPTADDWNYGNFEFSIGGFTWP